MYFSPEDVSDRTFCLELLPSLVTGMELGDESDESDESNAEACTGGFGGGLHLDSVVTGPSPNTYLKIRVGLRSTAAVGARDWGGDMCNIGKFCGHLICSGDTVAAAVVDMTKGYLEDFAP